MMMHAPPESESESEDDLVTRSEEKEEKGLGLLGVT